MVRLSVALNAASARAAQDLVDALRFIVLGIRLDAACLGCSTWSEPDWTVHYVEQWATEADMRLLDLTGDKTELSFGIHEPLFLDEMFHDHGYIIHSPEQFPPS